MMFYTCSLVLSRPSGGRCPETLPADPADPLAASPGIAAARSAGSGYLDKEKRRLLTMNVRHFLKIANFKEKTI